MSKLVPGARLARPLFIGLLILSASLSAIAVRPASPPPPYKITGIKAMLFYDG